MNRLETMGYYRSEYVSGNAVRKTVPDRERRVYVDGQRVHKSEKEIRAGERALTMNAPHVAFLAIVSAVCLIMCVVYLHLQSDISETRTGIADLKTQISTLQSQNDALNYSINSYIDADYIYEAATSKLGMTQATGEQISKYRLSDSGYTVQYGDIPEN